MKTAIIGGTGWDEDVLKSTFADCHTRTVTTQWGEARVVCRESAQLVFVHRHVAPGRKTHLPPHRINYRANIAALQELGIQRIFGAFSVGGLHADWKSGSFAVLDQLIDFTSGRESTFHDDAPVHTDMTVPFDPDGSALLREIATRHELDVHPRATYICTNGPRFETPAEIRLFARWGADVVGMTAMPEVALAREAGIPYSALAVVTNAAAGISPTPLSHQEVTDAMQIALPQLKKVLWDASSMIV